MQIRLPRVFAIDEQVGRNPIRQLAEPSKLVEGDLPVFVSGRTRGHIFQPAAGGEEVVIVSSRAVVADRQRVLKAKVEATTHELDLSDGVWLKHPATVSADRKRLLNAVIRSWEGAFRFAVETADSAGIALRPPQVGAVHAAHAHWIVSNGPATIVMPTGTGKTETMLSLLTSTPCEKVLVIVPTDALRAQLTEKFLTLGILKAEGSKILAEGARNPVVCSLEHIPSVEEAAGILKSSHVIVTTSSIAGQCSEDVQTLLAEECPYLFIDEAHHAEAPTWASFKAKFAGKRVLQFTATPFREDGQRWPHAAGQIFGFSKW